MGWKMGPNRDGLEEILRKSRERSKRQPVEVGGEGCSWSNLPLFTKGFCSTFAVVVNSRRNFFHR